MSSIERKNHRSQLLVGLVAGVAILTHLLSLVQPSLAANGNGVSSNSEATSSTQPLWSYQVKPNSYVGNQAGQPSHYTAGGQSSLFDAFTSLSQRQGALTSSPFMSILPIILIAAGGLLLLLPMLTMMMASPFGGGPFGGGGFQNGFGYPQVGALSKRRSLDQHQQQRGLLELIEHVSTTIEDLSRKYSPLQQTSASVQATSSTPSSAHHKRAKALNTSQSPAASNEASQVQSPTNHKPAEETASSSSVLSNVVSSVL